MAKKYYKYRKRIIESNRYSDAVDLTQAVSVTIDELREALVRAEMEALSARVWLHLKNKKMEVSNG